MRDLLPSPSLTRQHELARLLARESQAVTVAELGALGFDRYGVDALVARGRLVRAHRGVYYSGDVWLSGATAAQCALKAAGPTSCLCLLSAAFHLELIKYPPPSIQVAVPTSSGRPRKRQSIHVHRMPDLKAPDVQAHHGLASTTAERTIFDLSSRSRSDADWVVVRRALKQATTRDHALPGRLAARLDATHRRPGAAQLRSLLGSHLPLTADFRSNFEEEFVEFCIRNGLPAPQTNVLIEGKLFDVAWIDLKVIIELDSYRYHGAVSPFEADRRIAAKLTAAGYLVIRITDQRFKAEPLDVLDDVRAVLALAGWKG